MEFIEFLWSSLSTNPRIRVVEHLITNGTKGKLFILVRYSRAIACRETVLEERSVLGVPHSGVSYRGSGSTALWGILVRDFFWKVEMLFPFPLEMKLGSCVCFPLSF